MYCRRRAVAAPKMWGWDEKTVLDQTKDVRNIELA